MMSRFNAPVTLTGEWREPQQLLGDQMHSGHASVHDDATALQLGFKGGTIEGPTHFSQFAPLLDLLWGQAWFERGCISAHFQNPCYAGERVRASVTIVGSDAQQASINMEKEDGTPVLAGTVSLGPDHPPSELDGRLDRLRPPESLRIIDQISVGDRPSVERAVVGFDDVKAPLYPFSLSDKLAVITEPHAWYTPDGGAAGPWGDPVLPLEMVSVLTQYTSDKVFPIRQPSVALFVDQEIRMLRGPLYTGREYLLEREVVALSTSRRTESFWVRTGVRDATTADLVATTLLHTAVLKESYTPAEAQAHAR